MWGFSQEGLLDASDRCVTNAFRSCFEMFTIHVVLSAKLEAIY